MSEKKRADGTQPTAVVVGVGAERGWATALCRRFAAAGIMSWSAGGRPGSSTSWSSRSRRGGGGKCGSGDHWTAPRRPM